MSSETVRRIDALRALRPDVEIIVFDLEGNMIDWQGPNPPPNEEEVISKMRELEDKREDPIEKLRAFLEENPDVKDILNDS